MWLTAFRACWRQVGGGGPLPVRDAFEAIPRLGPGLGCGGPRLRWSAATLQDRLTRRFLYRTLARLRTDAPLPETTVEELRWRGAPRGRWQAFCDEIRLARLRSRPHRWLAADDCGTTASSRAGAGADPDRTTERRHGVVQGIDSGARAPPTLPWGTPASSADVAHRSMQGSPGRPMVELPVQDATERRPQRTARGRPAGRPACALPGQRLSVATDERLPAPLLPIRELSRRGHRISLLAIVPSDFEATDRRRPRPYTERIVTVDSHRGNRSLRRRAERRLGSISVGESAARRLREEVADLLAKVPHDVVLFSGKRTPPALGATAGIPIVADGCDATLDPDPGATSATPRSVGSRCSRPSIDEVRRIERALIGHAAHVPFASVRDRAALVDPSSPRPGHRSAQWRRCRLLAATGWESARP